MADAKTATPAAPADEFYDEANEEFPSKEDLKDRLVAIWVSGTKGTRKGNDGKMYPWVETTTLVIDDGPDGKSTTDLVGPALVKLDNFQWSVGGMTSRLLPRIKAVDEGGNRIFKPMVGRINSRKNKTKGFSDSWSIAKPTEEDKVKLRAIQDKLEAITETVRKESTEAEDSAAFDE